MEHENIKNFLGQEYGLEAVEINPIPQGVLNSNFLVNTAEGRGHLFKIYNFKKPEELDFETGILQRLQEHDFPSPRLLSSREGSMKALYGEKPAVVYSYIEGETREMLDEELLYQTGALLAKMHIVLRDFPDRSRLPVWDPEEIKLLVKNQGYKLVEAGFPQAEELLRFLTRELEGIAFPEDLPRGITHQDVKPENILIRGGRVVGILDFDNSYYGTLLHDITTTIIWSCFRNEELDRSLLGALLSGYQSVRPLTENEKSSFDKALRFRLLREMFITPYATLHRIQLAKERSDYFRRLYEKLAPISL